MLCLANKLADYGWLFIKVLIFIFITLLITNKQQDIVVNLHQDFVSRGHIFSHVRPSYERAVSDLDKSLNISLWV